MIGRAGNWFFSTELDKVESREGEEVRHIRQPFGDPPKKVEWTGNADQAAGFNGPHYLDPLQGLSPVEEENAPANKTHQWTRNWSSFAFWMKRRDDDVMHGTNISFYILLL